MPEKTSDGTVAYSCECGKKWVFPKAEANTERKCPCGRTIVVRHGFIFGYFRYTPVIGILRRRRRLGLGLTVSPDNRRQDAKARKTQDNDPNGDGVICGGRSVG
jgi:hypothetical protein